MANAKEKTGPGWKISVAVFVIGAVVATVGWYAGPSAIVGQNGLDEFAVPGTYETTLDPGLYHVYGPAQSVTNFDNITGSVNSFSASDITVTNVDTGERIEVRTDNFRSIGQGLGIHWSVAAFDVDQEASFSVAVESEQNTSAAVFESIETSLREAVPWIIAMSVGSLVMVIGAAMWIVGMMRRSRAQPSSGDSMTPPAAPPGLPTTQPAAPAEPNQPPPPPAR